MNLPFFSIILPTYNRIERLKNAIASVYNQTFNDWVLIIVNDASSDGTYEYLEKMQERIVKFVAQHSKISEEKFKHLMFKRGELVRDVGTVLIGSEAVEYNLINQTGGLGQAIKKLRNIISEPQQKEKSKMAIEALEGEHH